MVIITDCMYRSAIGAIYSLHNLGEEIITVTTDKFPKPPAFYSKYIKTKYILSSEPKKYKNELIELCKNFKRPVLLPIGVFTLNIISENITLFKSVADFCISDKKLLDILNDKNEAKKIAHNSSIKTPQKTNDFPMVIKPFCGEKFNLKASERYKIVNNTEEFKKAIDLFSKFDDEPIKEEYIDGEGIGVSVIFDNYSEPKSVFCHRRLNEYPSSGGPSSCLETFKDDKIIKNTINMFKSVGFIGIAMAEYKLKNGEYYFLEINPRIWGSFSAVYKTNSDFLKAYVYASRNYDYKFNPRYEIKKVKFIPNIFASALSYLKAKKYSNAFKAFLNAINPLIPNAIFSIKDPIPCIIDMIRKRR